MKKILSNVRVFKIVTICLVLTGFAFMLHADLAPTPIKHEQGEIDHPSELIWLSLNPNVTHEFSMGCGSSFPRYAVYRYSGLIINESGEVLHHVTKRSTEPSRASSNAIRLGWGMGQHSNWDLKRISKMDPFYYSHINDGTYKDWDLTKLSSISSHNILSSMYIEQAIVKQVVVNAQGDTAQYRSSSRPNRLGNGWFHCEITEPTDYHGNTSPSEEFFLSPELERVDSIEQALGFQFDHDNDELQAIGDGFVTFEVQGANKKAMLRFLNTHTGAVSKHNTGYVRKANLTFDHRDVLITSNWDSESLYDPIFDKVYMNASRIAGILDNDRALVRMNKDDKQIQVMNKEGDVLGQFEGQFFVKYITLDGIMCYSPLVRNLLNQYEYEFARVVFDESNSPSLEPIDMSRYDKIKSSSNPQFYAAQTNPQFAQEHNKPIKQYVLNASFEVVFEYDQNEHPMYITHSGKVLTYSDKTKRYVLYSQDGTMIRSFDIAQELKSNAG